MTIREHDDITTAEGGSARPDRAREWSVAELAARVNIRGSAVDRIVEEVAAKCAGASVAPAEGALMEPGAVIPAAPTRIAGDPRLTPQIGRASCRERV